MAIRDGKWNGTTISTSRVPTIVFLVAMGLLANTIGSDAQTTQTNSANRPLIQRNAVGLNPQPEPPSKTKMKRKLRPNEMRGLNPQPEPPSKTKMKRTLRPNEMRGLNPQPEPPSSR